MNQLIYQIKYQTRPQYYFGNPTTKTRQSKLCGFCIYPLDARRKRWMMLWWCDDDALMMTSEDSVNHNLSENIWFVWSTSLYSGENAGYHDCDNGRTHENVKIRLKSARQTSQYILGWKFILMEMFTSWGGTFTLLWKVFTFWGSIFPLCWPLNTTSNPPKKSLQGSDLP